jgi:catechol 2,3-dioxygenase-like lactoylglutathione lyase family enzyme
VLTRIDHVGIACRSVAEKIAFYESVFGLRLVSQEVNEQQGVREAMLQVTAAATGMSWVQLLEPLGPDTPVGRFLARRGEGLHHVGYGVRISPRRSPPSEPAGSGCWTRDRGTGPWARRSPSCIRRMSAAC